MFEWRSMDEAASEIAAATGEAVELAVLLREAYLGKLEVCAVIPNWAAPGNGDLVFYTADGGRIGGASDGVFRHLSKHDFQALQTHKRLTLAGRRVELPNAATRGVIEAFIGPDAPTVGIGDLRVSAAEILRFVGSRSKSEARDETMPRQNERHLDTGVPKAEILAVFTNPIKEQTEEQWERMLGDPPKWLKGARIDRGGRGIQSRWNPARLAMRLAEEGHMRRNALGVIISRSFPEYLDEWEKYVGSFD